MKTGSKSVREIIEEHLGPIEREVILDENEWVRLNSMVISEQPPKDPSKLEFKIQVTVTFVRKENK